MFSPGEVISYQQMCAEENVSLQRGMNFRLDRRYSVVLMSRRRNAPYNDRVDDEGRALVYEGHDAPKRTDTPDPKRVDQPAHYPSGRSTQNGRFHEAATEYKRGRQSAELVRVYEKLHQGVWVYNGLFKLVDAWREHVDARKVFKFKLELADDSDPGSGAGSSSPANVHDLQRNRVIPAAVKLEVWQRDAGRCVACGSRDNLHFDHVIPFSRGGSSLTADNIQILCARHNLEKRDKIQ